MGCTDGMGVIRGCGMSVSMSTFRFFSYVYPSWLVHCIDGVVCSFVLSLVCLIFACGIYMLIL